MTNLTINTNVELTHENVGIIVQAVHDALCDSYEDSHVLLPHERDALVVVGAEDVAEEYGLKEGDVMAILDRTDMKIRDWSR